MQEKKTNHPQKEPAKNDYEKDRISEVNVPKPSYVTNVTPDEVPRRDGPGGE